MSKFNLVKNKVQSEKQLFSSLNTWRKENQKIVFTNGVFDLLHRGHVEYLAQTADLSDKLIVGINSDDSVKQLNKGDSRPLQDEKSRALIIAALEFVDAVVIFNGETPLSLIEQILPNVLVKGGDYDSNIDDASNKKYIVGSDVVKANGGKVEVIQFVEGYSTTSIEQKIKKA